MGGVESAFCATGYVADASRQICWQVRAASGAARGPLLWRTMKILKFRKARMVPMPARTVMKMVPHLSTAELYRASSCRPPGTHGHSAGESKRVARFRVRTLR